MWNFSQHSHTQELKMPTGSVLENPIKPTYMPAINRAGFYKYFFLVMMQEPEGLEKMLAAFCADTYKPGILNQPDVHKRDRTPLPALEAQASAIQNAAISSVCQEMAALVQGVHAQHNSGVHNSQPSVVAHVPQPSVGAHRPQPHVGVYQPQPGVGAHQPQPGAGAVHGQPSDGMTHEERMWKIHVTNSSLVGGDVDQSNAMYTGRPNYI
jgi:hypothetical protein